MVFRRLDVTVNSANNLKDLRLPLCGTMDVYVVVSLYGDGLFITDQRTSTDQDSGTSPQWGQTFSFYVDEAAANAGRLTLEFKIKDDNKLLGHQDVGYVNVQIKELIEQSDGGVTGRSVTRRPGKTKGFLNFSCKFGERFTLTTPPPISIYPANAGPSSAPQGNQTSLLGGLMTALTAISTITTLGDATGIW